MCKIKGILDNLINRYPILKECQSSIEQSYEILKTCGTENKMIYTCGNGGSASDAEHIVGELLKGFMNKRPMNKNLAQKFCENNDKDGKLLSENLQCGIRSFCLMSQIGISSAVSNDIGGEFIIAQQLFGLGRKGDVLLALTTSGNARNIELAVKVAHHVGISVIGLTGKSGGILGTLADVCIKVPEVETYKVQELHLPVYHALCQMLEVHFF